MLVPSSLMQSMASFVSQNVGAGKPKRARKSMLTGIGVGLSVGCQPDKDRSCSTGIYHSGNHSEHRILSVFYPCEKRNCFGRMTR